MSPILNTSTPLNASSYFRRTCRRNRQGFPADTGVIRNTWEIIVVGVELVALRTGHRRQAGGRGQLRLTCGQVVGRAERQNPSRAGDIEVAITPDNRNTARKTPAALKQPLRPVRNTANTVSRRDGQRQADKNEPSLPDQRAGRIKDDKVNHHHCAAQRRQARGKTP